MIGIFAPKAKPPASALGEGLTILSEPHTYQNVGGYNGPSDLDQRFDTIVTYGLRGRSGRAVQDYLVAGKQVVVIDFGFVRRVMDESSYLTGHWQVSIGGLNKIPEGPKPADRWKALGVPLRNLRGDRVYVCGQSFGDAQHGLSQQEMKHWAASTVRDLRTKTDREIVWRPHWKTPFQIEGVRVDAVSEGPMDWSDCHSVVTLNSTIGVEALIAGVPVVASKPAAYTELASAEFTDSLEPPSGERREAFFYRLAYGQWTVDEMKTGDAWRHVRSEIQKGRACSKSKGVRRTRVI